jgi:hypothetical protein
VFVQNVIRKLFALCLATALLAAPAAAIAQDAGTARTDGQCDAKADTKSSLWFGAGCLGGLIAVGAAYMIKPNPPATRLLGKSAEYTAVYVDEYQRTAVGIQTRNAWTGYCTYCVFAGVGSAIYVLLTAQYYTQ